MALASFVLVVGEGCTHILFPTRSGNEFGLLGSALILEILQRMSLTGFPRHSGIEHQL